MFLRRSAAAVAAGTVFCAVAPGLASAAPTAPAALTAAAASSASDDGLYGTTDPQYNGVWRQSLALLAQDTAGVTPAKKAVEWLVDQQCDDGSFTSYRADVGKPCGEKTVADTNATAVAVQALAALGGHEGAVKKAVKWLASVQNDDGGWGYNPGSPSDANSVSVVIGALVAAGKDPASMVAGDQRKSPYDALLDFQLGCEAKSAGRGAFAYQPDKKGDLAPNAGATAAAVLAGYGEDYVLRPVDGKGNGRAEPLTCEEGSSPKPTGSGEPARAAEAGAAHLAGLLRKNGGHLRSALAGAEDQPDWGNTADAVIALAAGGHGEQAREGLTWLRKHLDDWEKAKSGPAALGQLVLAAHATGANPRDFGGVNLVKRLGATGPKPRATAEASTPPDGQAGGEAGQDSDDNSLMTYSFIGAGLAAGIGIGIVLSGRRKKREV